AAAQTPEARTPDGCNPMSLQSQGRYPKCEMERTGRSGKMNGGRTRGALKPRVVMIGSEGLPFSKTGGLADVLGALPPAIARRGWDVTVVTPRYRGVTAGSL